MRTDLSDNARRRRRLQAAYTLPEVMVSVLIVGMMFTGLYAGISQGMAIINSARQNLRATQMMVDTMEIIRLYSWEQINSNGFIPTNIVVDFYPDATDEEGNPIPSSVKARATIKVTEPGFTNSYRTNLREIYMLLAWTNSTGLQTREMKTFVTKNGLQNYVYE